MENQEELKKPITWQELKDFVNSLPFEYMDKTARLLFQDESTARDLLEPFRMQEDIYMFDDNAEDCGTLEELKELMQDAEPPFDLQLCKLITKKGTPFLWAE